ncbi:MAG: hypothetical protein SGJ20_13500 [Planctomycetota bacterium]|nr:hypothetical protein [Planctomycetota bacterium]
MAHTNDQFEQESTEWNDDQLFVSALESSAFAEFDSEIDDELDSLVARYTGWAAPNATSIRRSSMKFPSAKPLKKPK